ncbi:MAG: hypothetical protein HY420_00435 [Candidatus Kerfeldbacteria bacterium]|nr:hypothetical protein [Candidatus Kerfeldbacteria bacterium]
MTDFDYEAEEQASQHARHRRIGLAAAALLVLFGVIPPAATTSAVVIAVSLLALAALVAVLLAVGGFKVFIDSTLECMGDR